MTRAPYELTVDSVIDACSGHDRQAVCAIAAAPSGERTGVLAHDPIVWTESPRGRVSALCELETEGRFDPILALFSQDRTRVLVGHPGDLRMYEVASGALLWQRSCPWWEVLSRGPETLVCVEYEKGKESSYSSLDARSGAVTERVAISSEMTPPTATIAKSAVKILDASTILPIEAARPWTRVGRVQPAFSLNPVAHAHLWPTKINNGELYLALSHSGAILQAMASPTGGRWWRPERECNAIALIDSGQVIVAVRDSIPVELLLLSASNGRVLQSMRLPTEQAEAVVSGCMDASESELALGTTLGRVLVLRVERSKP
ncbi:MAG: hypothetical protein U0269_24440 [Polyangiales bacterium]